MSHEFQLALKAIKSGNAVGLKKIIKYNPVVMQECTDNGFDTLLHMAINDYQEDCLKVIIEKLATAQLSRQIYEVRNWAGETPIELAISLRAEKLLNCLLEGVDKIGLLDEALDIRYGDAQNTLLHVVVNTGGQSCVKVVFYWLTRNDSLAERLFKQNFEEHTPLHLLAMDGEIDCLRTLLFHADRYGLLAELFAMVDCQGNTPLHAAVTYQNHDAIEALLNFSPQDAESICCMVNNEGYTPLTLYSCKNTQNKNDPLLKLLEYRTLNYPFKPKDEMVDVNAIINADPRLLYNPYLAQIARVVCEVMNTVRAIIRYSNTHPDNRFLPKREYTKNKRNISKLRYQIKQLDIESHSEEEYEQIKAGNAGNCSEYATAVARELQLVAPDLESKISGSVGGFGDHCYNLVFIKQGKAEICFLVDAWAGVMGIMDDNNLLLKEYYSYVDYSSNFSHAVPLVVNINHKFHKHSARAIELMHYKNDADEPVIVDSYLPYGPVAELQSSSSVARLGLFNSLVKEEKELSHFVKSSVYRP
jgi:ankyrin repeat protein